MKCYYLYDNCKCQAYVQEITYFFFWRKWYWKAMFYVADEFLPCDVFDGYADTETEAVETVHCKYEELVSDCHG